jgi:hypothetical protein
MSDAKSRARVTRLLSGTFRPDDIANLFLFARDHCDGRETIKDIGAFVAHHNERDKGVVTRSTREWFAVARYHFPRFGPGGDHDWTIARLPASAKDYFRIAVNRVGSTGIRRSTGLPGPRAHRIMLDLADRLILNTDGTWCLPAGLAQIEYDLVRCISSVIVVKPAFESNRLVEDFIATLKNNGLITKDEIRNHKNDIDAIIKLFAVSSMHNCIIRIDDGMTCQLKASPGPDEISVNAVVPIDFTGAPSVGFCASIFSVNLQPEANCHPEMIADPTWDYEIELAPDKRLSPLR